MQSIKKIFLKIKDIKIFPIYVGSKWYLANYETFKGTINLERLFLKAKSIKIFPLFFESKWYLVSYCAFKATIVSVVSLVIRRIFRFIKRIVLQSKVLSFPFILSLFFVAIFFRLGFLLEEFKSYPEAFWEFRDFFLTAIFITITTNVFQEEIRFRKKLSAQSSIYNTYRYRSEEFIFDLSNIIEFEPKKNQPILIFEYQLDDIFLKDLDSFIKKKKNSLSIVREKVPIEINSTLYLNLILKKFKTYMEFTNNSITENNIIGFQNHNKEIFNKISFYLDVKIETLQNVHGTFSTEKLLNEYLAKQIIEILKEIPKMLFLSAATLRRPWRWDLYTTFYIKKQLLNDGFYFYEIGEQGNTNMDKYFKKIYLSNEFKLFSRLRIIKVSTIFISFFTSYLILFKIKYIIIQLILLIFSVVFINKINPGMYKKRKNYYILLVIISFLIKHLNILF